MMQTITIGVISRLHSYLNKIAIPISETAKITKLTKLFKT